MNNISASFLTPTTRFRLLNATPGTFAEFEVVSSDNEGNETRRRLPIPPEILFRIMEICHHSGRIKTLHHLAFSSTASLRLGADFMYGKVTLGNKPIVANHFPLQHPGWKPRQLTSWTLAAAELGWIRELVFEAAVPTWSIHREHLVNAAVASGSLKHVAVSTNDQASYVCTKFASKDRRPTQKLAKLTIKVVEHQSFDWLDLEDDVGLAVERVDVKGQFAPSDGTDRFFRALTCSTGVTVVDVPWQVLHTYFEWGTFTELFTV